MVRPSDRRSVQYNSCAAYNTILAQHTVQLVLLTVALRLVQPSGWKPMLPRWRAQQVS